MTASTNNADVLVIGAGLSGLACALLLTEAGRTVRVIEARANPGGRIRSVFTQETDAYLADLGPTWIWPPMQPLISHWVDRLALTTFPQFEAGQAILDYGPDSAPVAQFVPSQGGIARLVGGPQAIVDHLVDRLPPGSVLTGLPVASVSTTKTGMVLETRNGDGPTLKADQVIVAVPPRIARHAIAWIPQLPDELARALDAMPTWMAPQAKVVALYEEPFWRSRGLSGRIASQVGPLVEAHDHCGPTGSPAAIFGFIGWPYQYRAQAGLDLEAEIKSQLKRCFGSGCPEPLSVHVEDWAADPLVATPRDLSEPPSHPEVGPDILRMPHGDGRLWFASSETARQSVGLIEGAFDAAERTVTGLTRFESATTKT